MATGLAWTAAGGDLLFIEATKMAGKGGMTLTGQLGDVMKESAQAALSLPAQQGGALGINPQLPREDGHPPPLPGGRHPEGRPVGGRDHPHRAHLADDRHPRPQRHRDDRRGHPARPGAAGRRHQGEGARRAPRGHQAGHPARALPQGPGRRARSRRRRSIEFIFVTQMDEVLATRWRPRPSRIRRRSWPRKSSRSPRSRA